MDLRVPLSEVRLDKNFEERDPQNFDFLSFDIIIERCHQNIQSGQQSIRHGHLFSRLGCVQTHATLLANNSQHCCMLHIASVCTPCYMLLDVVARCCAKFETGQTFSPVQTDACWLRPFTLSLSLQRIETTFLQSSKLVLQRVHHVSAK